MNLQSSPQFCAKKNLVPVLVLLLITSNVFFWSFDLALEVVNVGEVFLVTEVLGASPLIYGLVGSTGLLIEIFGVREVLVHGAIRSDVVLAILAPAVIRQSKLAT